MITMNVVESVRELKWYEAYSKQRVTDHSICFDHGEKLFKLVKEDLGKEVEMGGCKGSVTICIVEPFIPHNEEFYLNIVSARLDTNISFSEYGGIESEENWDKMKVIFVPTSSSFTPEAYAPHVATLSMEIKGKMEEFIKVIFTLFQDLDFTFLEMYHFTLNSWVKVLGKFDDPYWFRFLLMETFMSYILKSLNGNGVTSETVSTSLSASCYPEFEIEVSVDTGSIGFVG
ncbi:hypothetical protein GQ457_15G019730 [Hibiscus cannabinus]